MTNDGVTRFNPNLYKNGNVCISILNTWAGEKWSSCQTISSVLIALCSVLNKYPFENEPGQDKNSKSFNSYHKTIEYKNIDFAICDIFLNQRLISQFQIFYPFMKQHFINNYEKLIQFIDSKYDDEITVENVNIYNMTTIIDYPRLKDKLIKTKQFIETIK